MPQDKRFYITTPIYYVNDVPHIGHAYTTVAADCLARYKRLKGYDVFFLTGTDEHGQKVEKAAKEKGRTPKEHADLMVNNFKNLWNALNITHDGFIRTTDEEHKKVVREMLQKLWDRKEIEKRSYSGMYCTPCERFWTDKDVVNGNCPDCRRPIEHIEEENYFFLMSKYQNRLIEHIEKNPGFILPEMRRNEALGFLRNRTLGDLCISRPKARLAWGIPLPFDENYTTYVWFDALLNYYSATKYLASSEKDWWPADHHLIGKDILTTHAVYWSTMLMALDMELPKNIFAHGWWTVEGQKMSKSLGNVVDPHDMIEKYGVDQFRYFLLREVPFGLDGDFSVNALKGRINGDLANDLGNLLSRTLTMIEKYCEGKIPSFSENISIDMQSEMNIKNRFPIDVDPHMNNLQFHLVLFDIWSVVGSMNRYIEEVAPWKVFKEENKLKINNILYTLAEGLRIVAVYLYPFMPSTAEKICRQLGFQKNFKGINFDDEVKWGSVDVSGTKVCKGEMLFPKIEDKHKGGGGGMKNLILLSMAILIIFGCSKGNDITAKPAQDKKQVRVVKLNVDMTEEQRLQKASDNGFQSWRNSPTDVAQAALVNAGANINMADCRLLSEKADEAVVAASDKKGAYKVICKRLVKGGGIWTATEVEVSEIGEAVAPAVDHEHMGHEHH